VGDICVDGIGWGCYGDAPMQSGCHTDSDCAAIAWGGPYVCWQCGGGIGWCNGLCAQNAECPLGASCDETGHCLPNTCAGDGDCPPGLFCSPADNVCERIECSSDAQCAGYYCIAGHCTKQLGSCGDCT
jgi:hypothetical protein